MESNPFSLCDKNILITGASSGIGYQCAISCSNMGANIILIGRNEEKLRDTYTILKQGKHLYYSSDITNYDSIEIIVDDAVKKIGPISGFIHSAGIELVIPLNVTKPKNYEEIFAVNVIAGFEFARILSKKKYNNSEGTSFVFISSVMGINGSPSLIGYSASKGAIISGVKSMALELASKKIRVNVISPAQLKDTKMSEELFKTLSKEAIENIISMHPLGLGNAIDVANACIYLVSDASKWITGINLIVDGGYSAK